MARTAIWRSAVGCVLFAACLAVVSGEEPAPQEPKPADDAAPKSAAVDAAPKPAASQASQPTSIGGISTGGAGNKLRKIFDFSKTWGVSFVLEKAIDSDQMQKIRQLTYEQTILNSDDVPETVKVTATLVNTAEGSTQDIQFRLDNFPLSHTNTFQRMLNLKKFDDEEVKTNCKNKLAVQISANTGVQIKVAESKVIQTEENKFFVFGGGGTKLSVSISWPKKNNPMPRSRWNVVQQKVEEIAYVESIPPRTVRIYGGETGEGGAEGGLMRVQFEVQIVDLKKNKEVELADVKSKLTHVLKAACNEKEELAGPVVQIEEVNFDTRTFYYQLDSRQPFTKTYGPFGKNCIAWLSNNPAYDGKFEYLAWEVRSNSESLDSEIASFGRWIKATSKNMENLKPVIAAPQQEASQSLVAVVAKGADAADAKPAAAEVKIAPGWFWLCGSTDESVMCTTRAPKFEGEDMDVAQTAMSKLYSKQDVDFQKRTVRHWDIAVDLQKLLPEEEWMQKRARLSMFKSDKGSTAAVTIRPSPVEGNGNVERITYRVHFSAKLDADPEKGAEADPLENLKEMAYYPKRQAEIEDLKLKIFAQFKAEKIEGEPKVLAGLAMWGLQTEQQMEPWEVTIECTGTPVASPTPVFLEAGRWAYHKKVMTSGPKSHLIFTARKSKETRVLQESFLTMNNLKTLKSKIANALTGKGGKNAEARDATLIVGSLNKIKGLSGCERKGRTTAAEIDKELNEIEQSHPLEDIKQAMVTMTGTLAVPLGADFWEGKDKDAVIAKVKSLEIDVDGVPVVLSMAPESLEALQDSSDEAPVSTLTWTGNPTWDSSWVTEAVKLLNMRVKKLLGTDIEFTSSQAPAEGPVKEEKLEEGGSGGTVAVVFIIIVLLVAGLVFAYFKYIRGPAQDADDIELALSAAAKESLVDKDAGAEGEAKDIAADGGDGPSEDMCPEQTVKGTDDDDVPAPDFEGGLESSRADDTSAADETTMNMDEVEAAQAPEAETPGGADEWTAVERV